jgi:hypothetical protein
MLSAESARLKKKMIPRCFQWVREKAGEKIWNSGTHEVTARQANETGEKVFNSEQSIKDAK